MTLPAFFARSRAFGLARRDMAAIVGLALAVALVALIVALVVRNLATAAGWLLGPGAVAYLVAMLIDWPWHVPAASATFAFILGALAGCGCAPGSAGRASARPSAS